MHFDQDNRFCPENMAVFRRSRVIVGNVNVLTKDLFLPVESVHDRTPLKFRGVKIVIEAGFEC